MSRYRTIAIHPAAPSKPALGAACNGCGVCCLAEPCPIGILVTGRRTGACRAVQWVEHERRYRCGLAADPTDAQGTPSRLVRALQHKLVLRFIAAGRGCDSDATLE